MTCRFHLFAHHQYVSTLAATKGGMDNYIAPFESILAAKARLEQLNGELVARKGGRAGYDYAQVAMIADSGRMVVVAVFDGDTGWSDTFPGSPNSAQPSGAFNERGPLAGYIVRRPVRDRANADFDVIGSCEAPPMSYVLVEDPEPGEEIFHGQFQARPKHSFLRSDQTVYDSVGRLESSLFGE